MVYDQTQQSNFRGSHVKAFPVSSPPIRVWLYLVSMHRRGTAIDAGRHSADGLELMAHVALHPGKRRFVANPINPHAPGLSTLCKAAVSPILLGCILLTFQTALRAQARASLESITLPTYEEGPPDPNPPFDIYASEEFNYPYTMRTSLTGSKTDHVWRAIILENEYLKCTILPDLGGHIYTCLDKVSGQPMFYENPSIKKAEIGHRGAWAAFGVEYNFPVSHNWASLSPIDFAYANDPDGSASVTVGNIDRPYGMQWTVQLVLRPKSTLLEERVTLYNRSDVRHRYYWWDNAAVQVWEDSRLDYPMNYVATHYFTDVLPWPNLRPGGKDVRFIANQTDGPVSYFAHDSHEPFMGVWNPKTNSGTAHFAEFKDLPAKKVWSWGADAEGLAWRKALSDNESAYVEVQAGLFRNQETYAFLDPGQTIHFTEYWMPVRGTGGITRANKVGIVHLDTQKTSLVASLNVNAPITRADVSLRQGDKVLWHESLNLDPATTWTKTVDVRDATSAIAFELRDREGQLLLTQTGNDYDLDPPSSIKVGPQTGYPMPGPEQRSEDDWLQFGTDQELNGRAVQAMTTYETALQKFPRSFSLEVAAGRLAASLQRYVEAAPLLEDALSRDTPNSTVAYYLGLAREGLGEERASETAFDIAYRQDSMRAPAAIKLGELQARVGKLQAAIDLFKAAVTAAPDNSLAREELEAFTHASVSVAKPDTDAQRDLELSPTSDFLKEELGAPDINHLAADPYRVLRVAAEYMQLGLYDKALNVLTRKYPSVPADQSEPGSVLPQDHPLVLYYAAYCRMKLDRNQPADWATASGLSTDLVFPSTETDRIVLQAALSQNTSDVTAHYLLGTLLFSEGLFDEAIQQWKEAKALRNNLPVVDADLGKAWLLIKHDTAHAQQAFIDGTTSDPGNADIYVGLDQALSLTLSPAAERASMLSRYPHADDPHSTMPAELVYQLALTRAEAGQFNSALSLFKDRFFAREEGGIPSDQVLFEVELMQAEAYAETFKCVPAKSFLIKATSSSSPASTSRTFFKMARIAEHCGMAQQERVFLQSAAAENQDAENLPWILQADKALGADLAKLKASLQASIPSPEHLTEISTFGGRRWYIIGLEQAALGENSAAAQSFRNVLLLPDSFMSHHLARAGLASLPTEQHAATSVAEPLQLYSETHQAMATTFSLYLYAHSQAQADQAAAVAFQEVDRVEDLLSNYRDTSELSRLNQQAFATPVTTDPEMFRFLETSLAWSARSNGAFDITVGKLMKTWGFYTHVGRVPTDAELDATRPDVGWKNVQLNSQARTVRFLSPGLELDPGGIGKGYAVERAADLLRGEHIEAALLSAGSSTIYALGAPPGKAGWLVNVPAPGNRNRTVSSVTLRDTSLSTANCSEKHFVRDGHLYCHIMDPRTLRPVEGVLQVTVTDPSATDSDALSNVLFVLGPAQGRLVLRDRPSDSALIARPGKQTAIYEAIRWKGSLPPTEPGVQEHPEEKNP